MNIIPELEVKDKQEVQAKRKAEYKYINSIWRIKGLTLYEYNPHTRELKEAAIEHQIELSVKTMRPEGRHKVTYHQDCIYFQALNIENAKRKLKKLHYGLA